MYKVVKEKKVNPENVEWKIATSGVSQGAIYYIVESQKTLDLLKKLVPQVTPPVDMNDTPAPYKYVVFGPGELPYRYIRWRIPGIWKQTPLNDFEHIIRAVNEDVDITVPIVGGGERKLVIRAKRILDDKDKEKNDKDKKKEKKKSSQIMLLLEVEERLVDVLVKKCDGMLAIGPNKGRLEGGSVNGGPGIQEMVSMHKEKLKAEKVQDTKEKEIA